MSQHNLSNLKIQPNITLAHIFTAQNACQNHVCTGNLLLNRWKSPILHQIHIRARFLAIFQSNRHFFGLISQYDLGRADPMAKIPFCWLDFQVGEKLLRSFEVGLIVCIDADSMFYNLCKQFTFSFGG